MSRASRRRRDRESRRDGGSRGRRTAPVWIMAGSIGAALLLLAVIAELSDSGVHHPEARSLEQRPRVMQATRYAGFARVTGAYEMAAAIPDVLDALYCYCGCSEHFAHYSLLDCFTGDHGAGCDICITEAEVAFEMTRQGLTVDQVRSEIDRMYES